MSLDVEILYNMYEKFVLGDGLKTGMDMVIQNCVAPVLVISHPTTRGIFSIIFGDDTFADWRKKIWFVVGSSIIGRLCANHEEMGSRIKRENSVCEMTRIRIGLIVNLISWN